MSSFEAEQARISAVLHEHLPPEQAATVLAAARPALELTVDGEVGEPLGCSYFGGHPLLPPSVGWPCRGEAPLEFLAVIDLSAVHSTGACPELPGRGVLNFFHAGNESEITGLHTHEADGWRVILADGSSAVETPAPEGTTVFTRRPVHARALLTLPDPETATGRELHEVPQAYFDACEAADPSPSEYHVPRHLLGGWPDLVQTPFWEQCALVSNGFAADQRIDEPGVAEVCGSPDDWRLLLQLDTDGAMDEVWDWGDTGRLYFAMRAQDLRTATFSGVWITMQST